MNYGSLYLAYKVNDVYGKKENCMKRKSACIVMLLVCVSLLFAGGAAESKKDTPLKDASVYQVAEVAKYIDDDPSSITGTVRFWTAFKGDAGMNDIITAFNKVYPNIKVELNTYSNNSNGNVGVDTALMAGDKIDVLHTFGLNNTTRRWQNDLFIDLSKRLAADGLDVKKEWGSDAYTYEGKYYTIPMGGLSNYVAINMKEWNKANLGKLPTEWTWDEYLEASRKMTHGEGASKVYGGSDYHSINYFAYPLRQMKGYDVYYKEDGTSNFDDPEFLKALKREIMAEQQEKIWFPLTVYRSDSMQAQMTYTTGQVASIVMPNVLRFIRDTKTYPVDWITGFAPYPVEEKGQPNYMAGVSIYSHAGICKGTKNFEAAYAFLKFFSTYGSINLVSAGHMPTWKGTNLENAVQVIFGSREKADKIVDVPSMLKVVFDYSSPSYIENNTKAYSEIESLINQYVLDAHNGKLTPEQALEQLKIEADEAIKNAE